MFDRLSLWSDAHRPEALDLIRVFLGVGLFIRGVVFLTDSVAYADVVGDAGGMAASIPLMHYVALAHLGGGLLLALGAATRVAAAIQIPILLGAVFVVHLPNGVTETPFAFAALVLVLLSVFVVWGAGPLSLDHAIDRWVREDEDAERLSADGLRERLRTRERQRRQLAAERPAQPIRVGAPACACGGETPVRAVRTYGTLGSIRFATGTHPRPATVEFRCRACDGVVEVRRDAETLEAYRYGAVEA